MQKALHSLQVTYRFGSSPLCSKSSRAQSPFLRMCGVSLDGQCTKMLKFTRLSEQSLPARKGSPRPSKYYANLNRAVRRFEYSDSSRAPGSHTVKRHSARKGFHVQKRRAAGRRDMVMTNDHIESL